jgi:hypothetical protein
MHTNRMSSAFEYQLPRPPEPAPMAAGFVLLPLHCLPEPAKSQATQLQWIYQQALEAAKAVARPSLPERDLLGYWN